MCWKMFANLCLTHDFILFFYFRKKPFMYIISIHSFKTKSTSALSSFNTNNIILCMYLSVSNKFIIYRLERSDYWLLLKYPFPFEDYLFTTISDVENASETVNCFLNSYRGISKGNFFRIKIFSCKLILLLF